MEHYSQNTEFKRGQIRSNLGLATIIESDNSKRKHDRSAECAKFGLNALLVLTIAFFAAGAWIATWFFFPAVTLAMFYVFCAFITRPESPNEN